MVIFLLGIKIRILETGMNDSRIYVEENLIDKDFVEPLIPCSPYLSKSSSRLEIPFFASKDPVGMILHNTIRTYLFQFIGFDLSEHEIITLGK